MSETPQTPETEAAQSGRAPSGPAPSEPTPRPDPSRGLLSEQARWMVTFALGMALVAAMIANWRFVFLAPLLVIWFSLPYLYAVEPPADEGADRPPHHDGWS